jgi:hypothetical protein
MTVGSGRFEQEIEKQTKRKMKMNKLAGKYTHIFEAKVRKFKQRRPG